MVQVKSLAALLLVLAPLPALAIDMDFYTYNGFDETVAAFTRLALIFSDNRYLVFFGLFAVLGIIFGGLSVGMQGLSGGGTNPIAPFIPVAIGLAIAKGLLFPTGTVHVYDPARNAYQPVAQVPDLIILLAGGLNKIERGLVNVVDTASANPYGEDAGALSYSLIRAAQKADVNDYYLKQSLINYYLDCGVPALGQGTGGERQKLLHNTDDPMTEFGKWTNAALFTTYHGPGDDGGTVLSCEDAWNNGLKTRLLASTTFDGYTASTCEQAGFNVGDTAQLNRCKSQIAAATTLFGVTTATDQVPLLRAMVMAKAVSGALNSADFSQAQRTLVDRQIMAESFGTAQAMDQWVPKVRAFLTAVSLGIVPIVALFLVTPMFKPSLMLLMGLFSWLAMWGICDAMAVQMAQDAAVDAFDQISRQRLGIDAILHSPEAAVQALGVFGKSRMVAITLATVLSAALFKFGGYAFARLGEQWQSHLEQAGEQSGRQTMLPEEQARLQEGFIGATSMQAALATQGYERVAAGRSMGDMRASREAGYVGDMGQTLDSYATQQARLSGSQTMGNYAGIGDAAHRQGMSWNETAIETARQRSGDDAVGGIVRRDSSLSETGDRYTLTDDETVMRADETVGTYRGQTKQADLEGLSRSDVAQSGSEYRTQRALAETEQLKDHGVTADRIGGTDADFGAAQSIATDRAGYDAVLASSLLQRGEQTGRAAVASEFAPGQEDQWGYQSGVRQGSIDGANLWRDESVARQLGLDTNQVADNYKYQQMTNSHVQLAPSSAQEVLRLADDPTTNISESQREAMRENPNGNYVMNFHKTEDGWANTSIVRGSNLTDSEFTSFNRGSSTNVSDTYTLDASKVATGGNALLEGSYVEQGLMRAFDLDGGVNNTWAATFGKAYGGALSDRGYDLSSDKAESLSKSLSGGAYGDLGIRGTAGVPGVLKAVLPASAESQFSAGFQGSADISRGWSDTNNVHGNENLLLTQTLGAGAVVTARDEYLEKNGALPQPGTREYEDAVSGIYSRAGEIFRDDFNGIVSEASSEREDAMKGNEVLEKAESLLERNDDDPKKPMSGQMRRAARHGDGG
jgi:hypothetical protein